MSIDLPLNPNIFILGDFDSITNISKDQGYFILRASLIGKKLILQKWKSAKEIKIDVRSEAELLDPLGFFLGMSQTSVLHIPNPNPLIRLALLCPSSPSHAHFVLILLQIFISPSQHALLEAQNALCHLSRTPRKAGGHLSHGSFSCPPASSPLCLFSLSLSLEKHTETGGKYLLFDKE